MLKTMYSYETHDYGGCNQWLTSRASTLPISRKVSEKKSQASNSELRSAHKERQKFWFSIQKLTFRSWEQLGPVKWAYIWWFLSTAPYFSRAHPADRSQ